MDIKICGLKDEAAVDAVIAGGATHAGFIFFAKSPRNVTPKQASPLATRAREGGLRVAAVTVDADDEFLADIIASAKPDILQLHGKETPERLVELKARTGLEIWKALAISEAGDLAKLEPYRGIADRFLLDAKPPKGSEIPGGNAVSFDWALLSALPEETDYLLAGGINAGNLGKALAANPPGLDISSGVETAPGIKDPALIAAFLAKLRDLAPLNTA